MEHQATNTQWNAGKADWGNLVGTLRKTSHCTMPYKALRDDTISLACLVHKAPRYHTQSAGWLLQSRSLPLICVVKCIHLSASGFV